MAAGCCKASSSPLPVKPTGRRSAALAAYPVSARRLLLFTYLFSVSDIGLVFKYRSVNSPLAKLEMFVLLGSGKVFLQERGSTSAS